MTTIPGSRILKRIAAFLFVFALGLFGTSLKTAVNKSFQERVGRLATEVAELFLSAELYAAVFRTIKVFILAGSAAIVVGTGLALLIHLVKRAAFIEIGIRFVRPIPSIAMIAIGVLLLSTASTHFAIVVVFLGSLWPFTVTALESFRRVPEALLDSAITLGKSQRVYVRDVLFPASLPGLFAAVRLVVPIILLLTITMEYLYHNLGGIGSLLYEQQASLRYPGVLCTIALMAALGWILETMVGLVEARTIKWQEHTVAA